MTAARLRLWWQETHSPQIELCRHFCGQFFESEFVARPGQLKLLFGGMLSVLASLSVPFLQAYYGKYLFLKALDNPEPFRLAVIADVLFLISLSMLAIGLVTTLLWQSLFPDRRDYLALASLPLRAQQIFRAKFTALLGFIILVTLAIVVPAAFGMPWMMQPVRGTLHYAVFGATGWQSIGILTSCFAAGIFMFFVLVALQGILLNVLPLRLSTRLSFWLQASLLILFLAAFPLVVAIPRITYSMNLRPDWAIWAPPLWFLGLDQIIAGSSDPFAARLARGALAGLASSALAAIVAYWWSYVGHRVRVLETPDASRRREPSAYSEWTFGLAPRAIGVFAFVAKTLGRSPRHRLILTVFAGFAVALSVNTLANAFLNGFNFQTGRLSKITILLAAQLALSLFTLCGLQYLYRLPVEPRSNWIFRVYEPGHTPMLLAGVEASLLYGGVAPVALLNLLVSTFLLGIAPAAVLALLTTPPALLLMEGLQFTSYKIPFTSLYLPARRMITETIIKYVVGIVLYISLLSALLSWCAQDITRWLPATALMLIAYIRLRIARLDIQRVARLEFEELPEVMVQTLALERD
ncbi:MAG: hypothetical protein ABI811_12280 [Acidobacteriota bacterium]